MKKILSGAFLSLCLLSSCAEKGTVAGEPAPKLDGAFSAQAEITFGKETCKAQLRRFSSGNWELCVTEPYALEGLVVKLDSGETALSMYGLDGVADCSENAVSAARLIAEAMDAAATGSCAENSGTLTVSGEAEHSLYTLTLNDAGEPDELKLSGRNIAVRLSDYTELPVSEQTESAEYTVE